MVHSQGTKFSPHNTVLYESLGTLIKDYRQWRKLSQETLAELIGVGVRELRNWEADRRRVSIENLHDISEVTGIPMQVCVALNVDQPIWYSMRKRLFMYSSLEEAQLSSYELFQHREKSGDKTLLKRFVITKDRQIDMILSCHQDLYGSEMSLRRDAFKAAISLVPELNSIIFDSWGHYVGHLVCLPIKMDVYRELMKQKTLESYLTSKMISDIKLLGEGVFFFYSAFAANISTFSTLYQLALDSMHKMKHKERYLTATHVATSETTIIQKNLNMRFVRHYSYLHDEIAPTVYEMELDSLLGPNGPVSWTIEQIAQKALIKNKNLMRRTKQVWSPEIPAANQATLPLARHDNETEERAHPNILSVKKIQHAEQTAVTVQAPIKPCNRHKGCGEEIIIPIVVDIPFAVDKVGMGGKKTEISELDIEACPNPNCNANGNAKKSNIVYNGTYRTKQGTLRRRFLCNKCGVSFSINAGTIFCGLQYPEEKVLKALKYLIEGMSIAGVANALGIKFDTVRRWLLLATRQDDKVEARLQAKLEVAPVQLKVLWELAKRHRTRPRKIPVKRTNDSDT